MLNSRIMWEKLKRFIKMNKELYSFISPFYRLIRKNDNASLFGHFFSSVVGGSVKVTVNNIPGEYEIDARSHILKRIMLHKEYEPDIIKHILRNIDRGKDAINVGANVGLITNFLAGCINPDRKVLAIEPAPTTFKLLERNVNENGIQARVILFNGVAADKESNFTINVIEGNEEYSSMGSLVHPSIKNRNYSCVEVRGDTIDNMVNMYDINPGIIVIDVEGAEYSVLKGSISSLKMYRPIIISEIDDNLLATQKSNSKMIFKLLEELNYKVFNTNHRNLNYPFSGNIIA